MADEPVTYTAAQAAAAATALRRAAGLEPERFPQGQFVGMISDEIRTLRERGFDDAKIAGVLAESGVPLDAATIGRLYMDTSQIKRER